MQKTHKTQTEKFAICVINFEPIKIQTCLAPQNDCLILNFVKNIHVVANKMTRSGLKRAIYHSQILGNTLYICKKLGSYNFANLNKIK